MMQPTVVEDDSLGLYLRGIREEKKISISTLAKKIGFSKSHLSNVENDVEKPSIALLNGYERELKLSRDSLVRLYESRFGELRPGHARVVSATPFLPNTSDHSDDDAIIDFLPVKRETISDIPISSFEQSQKLHIDPRYKRVIERVWDRIQNDDSTNETADASAPIDDRRVGTVLPQTDCLMIERQTRQLLLQINPHQFIQRMDVFTHFTGLEIRDTMLLCSNSVYWGLTATLIEKATNEALSRKRLYVYEVDSAIRRCIDAICDSLPYFYGESSMIVWLNVIIQREIIAVHNQSLVVETTLLHLGAIDEAEKDQMRDVLHAFCKTRPDPVRSEFILECALDDLLRLPQLLASRFQITLELVQEIIEQFAQSIGIVSVDVAMLRQT
jgi:transcriptional regulator with XRE-family HTH domain